MRRNGAGLLEMLPAEILVRVLESITLLELPATLRALELTCTAWRGVLLASDALWLALADRAGRREIRGGARRRSLRLERTPAIEFRVAIIGLRQRSEHLTAALWAMAQTHQNLSASRVRKALAQWSPCLLDRISPVANATALMECCRARGVAEAAILASVVELVERGLADVNVQNLEGQTPLIIAAARGLPRVVGFLLGRGADWRPRGAARFQTLGAGASAESSGAGGEPVRKAAIMNGTHDALGWAQAILERERTGGVTADRQRNLLKVVALLEREAIGASSSTRPAAQVLAVAPTLS